jgi:uncharacterized membrane protein
MTRFCWWTLVWFGLHLVSTVVLLHYMGGWTAYAAEYDLNTRAFAGTMLLAIWLVCWFTIVKKEP